MSRIIVKNLPKKISEQKLRELFETKGFITDLQLKYSKSGVFRHFAFIGYKTNEEARSAKEYFHNTFVNASRIKVEICTNLSDASTHKSWKKQHETKEKETIIPKENLTKDDKERRKPIDDPEFKEFLELHKNRTSKSTWGDIDTKFLVDGAESTNSSETEDVDNDKGNDEEEPVSPKIEASTHVKSTKPPSKVPEQVKKTSNKDHIKQGSKTFNQFSIKLKNLPRKCKKKQLKQFLKPLKPQSIRIPPNFQGFAYASFKTEKEMNISLNKSKGFLGDCRIIITRYKKKYEPAAHENSEKTQEEDQEINEDLLAETGRIYVRNLCFGVTQSELEELFSKYGPLAETHLPLDILTKKGLGFAFVSYVFAEHAVKAFSELDGTVFQGRLLHLIPATPKKDDDPKEFGTNFKKKKEAKLKQMSGSSHNWNILFLGMNAVANVISEKYNVEKSKLLSCDSNESVAVRMALAETQVVLDTRKFLVEQGVELDAFSQAAAERSKTIIIVKNLPAKTTSKEISDVFSKHGTISRVILPPSGMVALVEFQEPTEAKSAFRKLAYSRFKHMPLYLEWAPINAINPNSPQQQEKSQEETERKENPKVETNEKSEEEDDVEPEPDTTLFVRNISFNTTKENLQEHFEQCGPIHSATISLKKDIKSGKLLSMGFGFVQFKERASAVNALHNLQQSILDGHALEIKFSTRTVVPSVVDKRKKSKVKKQNTCKILVKNIPFQASEKEIRDLFKEFGQIKFVRLPKKSSGFEEHRGFGFVEYSTKTDAKRAFETLCHSTHFFGRRLVLEWANPDSEDVTELRKKTAKDFYTPSQSSVLTKRKLTEDVALASTKRHKGDDDE